MMCLVSKLYVKFFFSIPETNNLNTTPYFLLLILDQLAKPTFRSPYAHTTFGSAPLRILSR